MSGAGASWPWRRTSLWRRSDVLEAWLRVVTVLVLVFAVPGAGIATGLALHGAAQQAAARQSAQRHRTAASISPQPGAGSAVAKAARPSDLVPARIEWKGPDGAVHTMDTAPVEKRRIGVVVRLWTDQEGRPVPAPLTPAQARGRALVGGTGAAAGLAVGCLLAVRAIRARLDRHRMEEWQREWAMVGPRWSRST